MIFENMGPKEGVSLPHPELGAHAEHEVRRQFLAAEANALVEHERHLGDGISPFDKASHAIDRVMEAMKTTHGLTAEEIPGLYRHLNSTFIEPLAAAEARPGIFTPGRKDWHVPPLN